MFPRVASRINPAPRRHAASVRPAICPTQETHRRFFRRQPVVQRRRAASAGGGAQTWCLRAARRGNARSPRSRPHPACDVALANAGHDTRALQAYLDPAAGHPLAPNRYGCSTCGDAARSMNASGTYQRRTLWTARIKSRSGRHEVGLRTELLRHALGAVQCIGVDVLA